MSAPASWPTPAPHDHLVSPGRRGWRCPCGLSFLRLSDALAHARAARDAGPDKAVA